jgi:hypothetical protein
VSEDWHKSYYEELARINEELGVTEESDSFEFGDGWRDDVFSGRVQLASDAFVEFDPEWFMAAHGSVKDDRCGIFMRRKVKKLRGCLRVDLHNQIALLDSSIPRDAVSIVRVFNSCDRFECPSCGVKGAAVREAGKAEAILKYASDKLKMRVEHFSVSLEPEVAKKLPHEVYKKLALKACLVRGIVGGCIVYHHFRYHDKDETYVGEPAHWFVAPHFHVLAFLKGGYGNCRECVFQKNKTYVKCREEGGCNGFEAVTRRANMKDGFVVKVAEDKYGRKRARQSIGGTLWYELSHVSLRRGAKRQVVLSWFGLCGRNKLRIPKGALPQREHLCKICHEPLYDVEYLGSYKDLLAFMACFKDGENFILDAKDKNGKWLWRAVHRDG